ncbi:hypothetical protein M3484_20750 [Pseudomonas sp. GX19020]|uniref:hypothetical protein n=1 Tax=Pseudomonas sp. GX19020 TaxID=2942277 RepID=UPI002019C7FE|nr:hypothetical protein [Pseudomonas sp. GX19020]MCL4068990.1 hypothetical protein [Pseudomonas sp. GX19020]
MTRTMDILLQHGRALEWLTSSILLGFAVTLMMPGETLREIPAFSVLAGAGLTDAMMAGLLGMIAAGRMAGLYINGAWRRSPRLRQIGSLMSAPMFGALGAAPLAAFWLGHAHVLSTGAMTYLLLACADILAAYRSSADAAAAPKY